MKKLFLLFIFISGISLTLFAQPTLTSSTAPKIGDVIQTSEVSTTVSSQGPAGANQTWDFSTVASAGSATGTYVNPATTTYSSDFSTANIASSDGNGDYGYFNITSSEVDVLGAATSAGYASYSDGEKVLTFPFTYNNSYTDNFSGAGVTSYPFTRSGSVKVTADAYGTLKTPAGTFTNVLRINMKENFKDTFPDLQVSYIYAYQSYIWHVNGFNNSLFTVAFDTTYIDGFPSYTQTATYSTEGPSGVKNISPAISFNVFPNPATDKIYLQVGEAVTHITVSNVLGQNVMNLQPENSAPGKPLEISVADLPSGIYLCNVITPVGNVTRRIVKE